MSSQKRRVNLDRIRSDAHNQRNAVSLSIRAAVEPLLQLPESITLLKNQGREEDIEKLEALAKTVAQDIDLFTKEYRTTNESFSSLDSTPCQPKHISRRFTEYMNYGLQFMSLNERVLGTAVKAADQMSEIILTKDQPSSNDSESDSNE